MPLTDHVELQERQGRERASRVMLPRVWGEFIAGLAAWSWFVTITFKNSGYKGAAPASDFALDRISEWLADLQAAAGGRPIGWVLAEEFGRLGGRWHCHLLICGVSHLQRRFWWSEAFRRFGRTRIEPFNHEQGAAFYTAKYAAKALGEIHFGGFLAGHEFQRVIHSPDGRRIWVEDVRSSAPCATHAIKTPSAFIGKQFFHSGIPRWHR
jgi:hypothetical protein